MPWTKWNKADKTLLVAFLVFLFALCVHLEHPANVFASGFLFCSEAALVGGIADWFAVTALFRKPLGFPYHTAILPRRRQAFIKASVTMVQKEFFSRRKIFDHLERLHILPMLMEWLSQPETESRLTTRLVHYLRDFMLRQDVNAQADALAGKIREGLDTLEPQEFFSLFAQWLRETGKDKEFIARVATYVRSHAGTGEARALIRRMLEDYQQENTGGLASFLVGLAQAVDLVNYDEAAELMQRQLLELLGELSEQDSALQRSLLAMFYEKAAELNHDEQFHLLCHELKDSLMVELPLEDAIVSTLEHLRRHFAEDKARSVDPVEEHLPALRSRLEEIIRTEYRRTLALVEEDAELRRSIGRFLYDLIARSALHAQTLVGVIVKNVLSRLTDEQLNHLVYDKVEPDLLWIRMNGSIVGAGIGAIMFTLLTLVQR